MDKNSEATLDAQWLASNFSIDEDIAATDLDLFARQADDAFDVGLV